MHKKLRMYNKLTYYKTYLEKCSQKSHVSTLYFIFVSCCLFIKSFNFTKTTFFTPCQVLVEEEDSPRPPWLHQDHKVPPEPQVGEPSPSNQHKFRGICLSGMRKAAANENKCKSTTQQWH